MKYKFDDKKADRAVAFIEGFCTHVKGELGGKPFLINSRISSERIEPVIPCE